MTPPRPELVPIPAFSPGEPTTQDGRITRLEATAAALVPAVNQIATVQVTQGQLLATVHGYVIRKEDEERTAAAAAERTRSWFRTAAGELAREALKHLVALAVTWGGTVGVLLLTSTSARQLAHEIWNTLFHH